MEHLLLNSGAKIPVLGLGTYKMTDDDETYHSVRTALDLGYSHIDTAALYGNEEIIGKAIKDSGIAREDLFVTTKLWTEDIRSSNEHGALRTSLKKLQMDYVDLYLVHWPVKDRYVSVWRDMERMHNAGLARAIGVSNYWMPQLTDLLREVDIMPAVNQIEFHPYFNQKNLVEYCKENDICVEGWRPLGAKRNDLLELPLLKEMSERYHKSPAQIILRWCIQQEVIVFPKSTSPERLQENIDIFDFALSDDDMRKIDALHNGEKTGANPGDFAF